MKLASALLLAAVGMPVQAQAETLLELSNSATVSVQPDEMAASLRAEATASTPATAQDAVNRAMAQALARAHAVPGVAAETGTYEVWSTTPAPNAAPRPVWHASQGLELHDSDRNALLVLVGALQQQGLTVNALGARLSAREAEAGRDRALRQAISGMKARADEAAALLGLRFVSFRSVHIEQPEPAPPPAPMRAMMAAPAPALPSVESGPVQITATVRAEAVLMPQGAEQSAPGAH